MGGLPTISLGSLAELTLALFVLANGETEVVQAQNHRLDHGNQPAGRRLDASAAAVQARQCWSVDHAPPPGRNRPAVAGSIRLQLLLSSAPIVALMVGGMLTISFNLHQRML
jgi:hypothetical protein